MLTRKHIYFILIALCALVYANSIHGEFILVDDIPAIVRNPRIARPLYYYWAFPQELLNSLSYRIARFNVVPYHICGIVLHAINTILVFFLLRLFFKEKASFIGACLFAVHPIHTEAVSWISGRSHVVIGFFVLVTYLLYFTATQQEKLKRPLYLMSVLIFTYYINQNYSFYTFFPFLLIFSDIAFKRWRNNWKFWLPFLLILAFRIILLKEVVVDKVITPPLDGWGQETMRNPWFYFVYATYSYLGLLLWPARLTFYHEPLMFHPLVMRLGMVVVGIVICFLPYIYKKAKSIFFGLGMFALFLVPSYSPFPIAPTVSERYAYLPSILLSILASFLYERCSVRSNGIHRKGIILLFIFVIAAYGARTVARNEDWRDNRRLWSATLEVSPKSPRSHSNMGVVYLEDESFEKAIEEFNAAINISPNYYASYNNLGALYKKIGKKEKTLSVFKMAVERNPNCAEARYNLGVAYGDIWHVEAAINSYKKTLEINPYYVKALNNLGNSYLSLSRYQDAIMYYRKAIAINPEYSEAYFNLGHLYVNKGENEQAKENLLKARELFIQQRKTHMLKRIDEYLRKME
ncbi:tetratricopeptide repeat protein [Candidatus Omnitrophota bacterium]